MHYPQEAPTTLNTPFFFDMIDAPALAIVINQLFCTVLCWRYRRHIQWRIVLPPTIAFSLGSLLALCVVGRLDLHVLVLIFAGFLITLALYFLLFAKRARLTPKPLVGTGCGLLCGISAGLFAVGGPPMAVYFVAAAADHTAYLACMQLLFTVTGIVSLLGRVANGLLHSPLCGAWQCLYPVGSGGRYEDRQQAERRTRPYSCLYLCGGLGADPDAAAAAVSERKPIRSIRRTAFRPTGLKAVLLV